MTIIRVLKLLTFVFEKRKLGANRMQLLFDEELL
jgi:hypothetical protein